MCLAKFVLLSIKHVQRRSLKCTAFIILFYLKLSTPPPRALATPRPHGEGAVALHAARARGHRAAGAAFFQPLNPSPHHTALRRQLRRSLRALRRWGGDLPAHRPVLVRSLLLTVSGLLNRRRCFRQTPARSTPAPPMPMRSGALHFHRHARVCRASCAGDVALCHSGICQVAVLTFVGVQLSLRMRQAGIASSHEGIQHDPWQSGFVICVPAVVFLY